MPATPGTSARTTGRKRPTKTAVAPRRRTISWVRATDSRPARGRCRKQERAEVATDLVADGVAEGRAGRIARTDHAEEAHVVLGGEHPPVDDGRLTGEDEPEEQRRLAENERRDEQVGSRPVEREQRMEKRAHRPGSAMAAV